MADPRIWPWLAVDVEQLVREAGLGDVARVEPIESGLTNTLHRAALTSGAVVGVKTFAAGAAALATERAVIAALRAARGGGVDVVDVLAVHEPSCSIVYRWIDGVTLHAARKRGDDLIDYAAPIGRALAAIACARVTDLALPRRDLGTLAEQLASPLVGERIGAPLARDLAHRFADLPPPTGDALVHGDFGGKNLLVAGGRLAGILDWEAACTGSPLWDVGHFFRYAGRYAPAFRAAFARAYRDAGGDLPEPWLPSARWLDAARLVRVLAEPRELPSVFADCRALLAHLMTGG